MKKNQEISCNNFDQTAQQIAIVVLDNPLAKYLTDDTRSWLFPLAQGLSKNPGDNLFYDEIIFRKVGISCSLYIRAKNVPRTNETLDIPIGSVVTNYETIMSVTPYKGVNLLVLEMLVVAEFYRDIAMLGAEIAAEFPRCTRVTPPDIKPEIKKKPRKPTTYPMMPRVEDEKYLRDFAKKHCSKMALSAMRSFCWEDVNDFLQNVPKGHWRVHTTKSSSGLLGTLTTSCSYNICVSKNGIYVTRTN